MPCRRRILAYIATGVDDDRTVLRNHDAFSQYQIRARRFNDLRQLSAATSVFGVSWPSPIYLSAVSAMRAFHPDAEAGVARAARSRSTQLMLSTGASDSPEAVAAARGAPYWQQLYPTDDWTVAEKVVQRAENAGCAAIVLTVDSPGLRNLETLKRATRVDNRDCSACHSPESRLMWRRAPIFSGLDVSRVKAITPLDITPVYLERLRRSVKGKLIIKGIVTREDAVIALNAGADGIVVSNHGGRNEETLRASVDCLAEVVRRGSRTHPGISRWRHSSRHGCLQGSGAGRRWCRHRPAAGLGSGRLRPIRSRGGGGHPQYRAHEHHAPGGHADGCGDLARAPGVMAIP